MIAHGRMDKNVPKSRQEWLQTVVVSCTANNIGGETQEKRGVGGVVRDGWKQPYEGGSDYVPGSILDLRILCL